MTEVMHMCHCAQHVRAYATHTAMLEQLRGMLKAAKCGYGSLVVRPVVNPMASEEMREWRAGLSGYDYHGNPPLSMPRSRTSTECHQWDFERILV